MQRSRLLGYLVSLGAAICYAATGVLTRKGLIEYAPPLVGLTISLVVGTLAFAITEVHTPWSALASKRRGLYYFLLAGVAGALGLVANYFALSVAPVVLVSPIVSINPLISITWVWLFMQRSERVTIRVLVGALLVLAGVVLITVGRNTT